MKKALHISLARTLSTVEEDAYARLDTYLASVRAALANDAGKDEIVGDVEGRIAEKFLESGKGIITIVEVEAVIAAMGEASTFGAGAAADGVSATAGADGASASPAGSGAPTATAQKKFYRDPKNAMVGGVCAGLAAYFAVDVVWIRLLFVVAALANGFGVLVYLILWLIVPEAKSAAQRLEMEGVPVNLSTLAENARQAVDTGTSAAGRMVRALLAFVGTVLRFGVALFVIVFTLPVVLGLSVFVPFILANPGAPYFAFPLTDAISATVLWSGLLAGYFLIVLPCVLLFLAAVGLLRRKPVLTGQAATVLCLLWGAALMVGAAAVSRGVSTGEAYVRNSPAFEVTTRSVTVTGPFTEIAARNGVRLKLVQGDVPALEMEGRTAELDTMRVTEKDGVLTVSREFLKQGWCLFCGSHDVTVTVTAPGVETLRISGGSRLSTEEWKSEAPVALEVANGSRVNLSGAFAALQVTVSGGSRLDIAGSVEALQVIASNGSSVHSESRGSAAVFEATGGSSIEADRSVYADVTASARNGSRVQVGEVQKLRATAVGGSAVRYVSAAEVVEKNVSGGGSVRGSGAEYEYETETDVETPETPESAENPESPEAPVAP